MHLFLQIRKKKVPSKSLCTARHTYVVLFPLENSIGTKFSLAYGRAFKSKYVCGSLRSLISSL